MLLQVSGLCAGYGQQSVLRGVSFEVAAGEAVGMLGCSGSGKSTLARAILGMATVTAGSVQFDGRELTGMREADLRRVRGAGVAIVPQEPAASFHPLMTVGSQLEEVARAHGMARAAGRDAALRCLTGTGLEAGPLAGAFPHQLSGGQLQRAAIARALVCSPRLVIADEPASALDTASRQAIAALFRRLCDASSIAFLLITHLPQLLEGVARRVLVMHGGELIESGPASRILHSPEHPYTRLLVECAQWPESYRTPGAPRHVPAPAKEGWPGAAT